VDSVGEAPTPLLPTMTKVASARMAMALAQRALCPRVDLLGLRLVFGLSMASSAISLGHEEDPRCFTRTPLLPPAVALPVAVTTSVTTSVCEIGLHLFFFFSFEFMSFQRSRAEDSPLGALCSLCSL
jgi:hypothetical protein